MLRERRLLYTSAMDELQIESTLGARAGVRIFRLTGPFVLQGVFDFQAAVRAVSDPVTIIDLSQVPFMDSAALGAVMGLHVSCQRQARKYALVGASARLRTLFEVAGVHKLLVTYNTLAEAQEKLAANAAAQ